MADSQEPGAHSGSSTERTPVAELLQSVQSNNAIDDDENSDESGSECASDFDTSLESDSEDYPFNARLDDPSSYFRELDLVQMKNGSVYEPFNGHLVVKVTYLGSNKATLLSSFEVQHFFQDFLIKANEASLSGLDLSLEDHYQASGVYDRAVQNLYHFIECRNMIFWIRDSVESMEEAGYCGDFISILAMDKQRHDVSRLLPIQCDKIKELANAFESCLFELTRRDSLTLLFDLEAEFASKVSEVCHDILSVLDYDLAGLGCTALWRTVIHMLDMAVLSYAGAHTEYFGSSRVHGIDLPGPFSPTNYLTLRRRSFLCLDHFLGGREAWVLEKYNGQTSFAADSPRLYLSTEAATFGDIWGPMWKSCAISNGKVDSSHIIQYNVGNGVILPCDRSSMEYGQPIPSQKDEVLCHWISNTKFEKGFDHEKSYGERLYPDSSLLIGAILRFDCNKSCNISINQRRIAFRNNGALSEVGTRRNMRILDSEAVQLQVGGSYAKIAGQKTYKRRGVSWKSAIVEDWTNNPEGRNIKRLEWKLGVEVSTCTSHARRRRLISLLGSNTMMNYLKGLSLRWEDKDCEESFYSALKNPDFRAFCRLYQAQKTWQPQLGNAIKHCLDALAETGVNEDGLDMLWAPSEEPPYRVNLRSKKHSWVPFLKDTEGSCTMAVLEDKCLELQSLELHNLSYLNRCKSRAQSQHLDEMSDSLESATVSLLQTSCVLNEDLLPRSVTKGPSRRNGSSDQLHWRSSSIAQNQELPFGEKGLLRSKKSLGNGQILAVWRSSFQLWEALKSKLHSNNTHQQHQEYIRTNEGDTRPLRVLIESSRSEEPASKTNRLEHLTSMSNYTRPYRWSGAANSLPRTCPGSGVISEYHQHPKHDIFRTTLESWSKGEPATSSVGLNTRLRKIVDNLPLSESHRRQMDDQEAD